MARGQTFDLSIVERDAARSERNTSKSSNRPIRRTKLIVRVPLKIIQRDLLRCGLFLADDSIVLLSEDDAWRLWEWSADECPDDPAMLPLWIADRPDFLELTGETIPETDERGACQVCVIKAQEKTE